ncbi:MAG: hypothetical protein JNM31_11685 [Flavobacteriales bacterium]|nr:hypothetical protein [Flavobacteriales bacterium]
MDPNDLAHVARHVMKLLVERRFVELEEASGGSGLSADDMEGALDDIGTTLAMPPETYWRDLRIRSVRNLPDAYELTLEIWTMHGRTRNTVELMVRQRNGRPIAAIEEIIVA